MGVYKPKRQRRKAAGRAKRNADRAARHAAVVKAFRRKK